jgi:NADH:ubiquinone oxidoreductase subunit H
MTGALILINLVLMCLCGALIAACYVYRQRVIAARIQLRSAKGRNAQLRGELTARDAEASARAELSQVVATDDPLELLYRMDPIIPAHEQGRSR